MVLLDFYLNLQYRLSVVSKCFRRFLCKRLFACAGKRLNVEQGAYFGNGKNIKVGDEVGAGKNFKVLNRTLQMGSYIMMAEGVLFLKEDIFKSERIYR